MFQPSPCHHFKLCNLVHSPGFLTHHCFLLPTRSQHCPLSCMLTNPKSCTICAATVSSLDHRACLHTPVACLAQARSLRYFATAMTVCLGQHTTIALLSHSFLQAVLLVERHAHALQELAPMSHRWLGFGMPYW
jgi:hypothetical protein